MQSKITAIGTANPAYKGSQQSIAELIAEGFHLKKNQQKLLKAIYKASGIETRYSVIADYSKAPGAFDFFPNEPNEPFPTTAKRMQLYKENALPLALDAIENCFSNLKDFNPDEITHLITVSCTGMYAPGIDIEIVQKLKLKSSTKRTSINFMGCYGAFNGLKVADAFCQADPSAKVLLVCVEICSIHFQNKFNSESIIANAIFADGAAAALIEGDTKNSRSLNIDTFYCDLVPQTSNEMAWGIGDSGFDMVLTSYVPQAIRTGILNFSENLFKLSNYSLTDIDYYAIHPGGLKILQACEEALGISEKDNYHSYKVLRNFGNMSSATVLFVIKNIWDSLNKEDHNKNIFSCAFGPGLTLESVLLQIKF